MAYFGPINKCTSLHLCFLFLLDIFKIFFSCVEVWPEPQIEMSFDILDLIHLFCFLKPLLVDSNRWFEVL